jgi:hypothetical protein
MNHVSLSSNLRWPVMGLRIQVEMVDDDERGTTREGKGGKVFKSMVAGACA